MGNPMSAMAVAESAVDHQRLRAGVEEDEPVRRRVRRRLAGRKLEPLLVHVHRPPRVGAGECLFDAVLRDRLHVPDGLRCIKSGRNAIPCRLLFNRSALAAADDHGTRGEESWLRRSANARHVRVVEQERAVLDGVAAHDVDLAPLVHRHNCAVQVSERPENRHDRLDRVDRPRHGVG